MVAAAMEGLLALLHTDLTVLRSRGVTCASIIHLDTRLVQLEGRRDQPDTPALTQQLIAKLSTLDAEFKVIHFQIVDLINRD